MTTALLISVFLIATCGLIYQLIAGTVASYVIGDSVTQFSTIIGTYLFSMGIGSYLSQFVRRDLIYRFVQIELIVGFIGGCSAMLMFVGFSHTDSFRFILYMTVVMVGTGVGLEIPLLLRILKDQLEFEDLVAKVLTLDYVGALVASLMFPMVLVPHVGLMRSSFLFGLLNALVALASTFIFRDLTRGLTALRVQCVAVITILGLGAVGSDRLTEYTEQALYSDEVILTRKSPYQRIVLTKWRQDMRLYLNGHLQFSSIDEYRYHETLIHPALSAIAAPRRALVLGGGDGLAVREILKYPGIETVHLVDLDPEVTRLFSTHPILKTLNDDALNSPRVQVTNADGFVWLDQTDQMYDFIVVDLPDPSNYSVGKLYTRSFYELVEKRLGAGGYAVIQSTSPMFARTSFWCIARTIASSGMTTSPMHAYVPTFGEWGFVIAGHRPYVPPERLPDGLRFVTKRMIPTFLEFPPDMEEVETEINRLNDQVLVRYYDREWKAFVP